MAAVVTPAGYLRRLTGHASIAGNYSIGFWIHVVARELANYSTAFALIDDAAGAYAQWIGIYRVTGTDTWRLDITGLGVTAAFALAPGSRAYFKYNRAGTQHRFYANGTLIGSLTGSVAAFVVPELYLGHDTFNNDTVEIAHVVELTTSLTNATDSLAQMGADGVGLDPADYTLHAFATLASSSALGTFTAVGSVTYAAQPGIPGNSSAFTARVLASTLANGAAQSVTQSAYFNGTTYTLWYRYTSVAGENQIGLFAYGNFSTYRPVTTIRWPDPDASSLLGAGKERCIQFPANTPGVDYYLQFNKGSSPDASPSTLTVEWYRFIDTAVPVGAIGVNDEKTGLPTVFVSRDTNYLTYRFVQGMANGDHGAQLADGTLALDNGNRTGIPPAGQVIVYDLDLSVRATIARTLNSGSITSNRLDAFYILAVGTTSPVVEKRSPAGVLLATLHPTGGFFNTMCVSPDDAILYYTNVAGTTIKRWNIATDSALSDLVAGLPALPSQTEMLCLDDGSVIVLLANLTVRRYSAAGALLNTYTFPAGSSIFAGSRLAHDLTDAYFWVRDHDFPTYNTFYRITVATGAQETVLHASFLRGVYGESDVTDPTPTPLSRFGTPESCPIWIVPGSSDCPPTAPLQIACWDPGTPTIGCGPLPGPAQGACFSAHDIDRLRTGLLNTGRP